MSAHPLERICPMCGSEAGQPCISKRGFARKSFHRSRGSRRHVAHPIYKQPNVVTESPIEKELAGCVLGWIEHSGLGAKVTTQAPVGPFRADILIEEGERRLVVECDGRDFHNSKEQVERDKRRDRYCVARGYSVMRFSGAEITRDVRGCAAEIGLWIKLS